MIKKPWLEFPHVWKTEAAFMAWLRGGIRRSLWNKSPIKLSFIKDCRKRIVNPVEANRKRFPTCWGAQCYVCGKDFALKDLEVDHLIGGHSLRQLSDLQSFIEGIVCVSKENLGFICKHDHKAKTYAERMGISHEDSVVIKEAILICKQPANAVKEWIQSYGQTPGATATQRRLQVEALLKEVSNNE